MSPEELREKIRVAAINFTEEVSAIFGEAFASVADEFQTGAIEPKTPARRSAAPAQTKPARTTARPAKAGKPSKTKPARAGKAAKGNDKRNRRSASELDRAGGEVINLLRNAKRPMRVEEMNKQLGTTTRELMRPIQKLLADGKIKKSGERRATTYHI